MHFNPRHAFFLLVISAQALLGADPPELPIAPDKALETIHIRDGFTVELVAAEPMVMDPVAIAWGADGRLWVAEMADYPSGMDGKGKAGGRIRFLEDTDADGRYDRSTVFLKDLNFPTGVLPWRDGVLITAAPEILFARDSDGDGVADEREVLFKGFHEGNQQLRVNGLQRGLDNWIHCASGSHHAGYGKDSRIESTRSGKSITLGSLDFRFRPDTGELEPQSGPSQFGRNRDEWGNWFGSMNSHPIWHYVLEDSWLRRNPYLKPPDTRRQLILPRNPRVYPAKAPQKRFHSFEQTGRFTSACGGMIYRGDRLFPRDGRRHAFACEPFHNLVQHIVVEEDGFSFKGTRDAPDGTVDFFASTDRWCRPVSARTGPDGALWIVDMYRYIIEHSQWLPETGKKELAPFLRAGDDRGRIYRVIPESRPPRRIPALGEKSGPELVAALNDPSGPVRDLAQDRLLASDPEPVSTSLKKMINGGDNPFSRLHAIWTLEGLDHLTPSEITAALGDDHADVRRNAVRLAGEFAGDDTGGGLTTALAELTSDPSPRVRLQLAATLGQWPDDEIAARALARLAVENAGDRHFDAAVLSSVGTGNIETLIEATLAGDSGAAAAAGDLAGQLLALSVALGKDRATLTGLEKVLARNDGSPAWKFGMIAGLLDALRQHDSSIEKLTAGNGRIGAALSDLTADGRKIVGNTGANTAERSAALRLLARSDSAEQRQSDIERLGGLLVPATPPALQSAAISHLATLNDPAAAGALLAGWKSHGPAIRAEVLGVIPTRKAWIPALLDAIEAGRISPGDIGPFVRKNLTRGADRKDRARLTKLFAGSAADTRGRKEIVAAWKPALELEGNKKNGAEIFKLACASCHQLDGVGLDIGPSLASLSDRRPIALFTAILDPNAQLDARYSTYVASTRDGRNLIGFLAAETANSITLKGADSVEHQILRDDLETLESTGLSLMPEGLEAALDHQKLADLIAYLATAGLPEN